MDNSKQTLSWTDKAINVWRSKGIKLQNGISIGKISDFEKLLDLKFPQDFVELYSIVNGFDDFDWNEHMFSLWSLDRILKEYQEDDDTNYVGVCDYLINSHSIGFYKSDRRIYKYYNKPKPLQVILKTSSDCLTQMMTYYTNSGAIVTKANAQQGVFCYAGFRTYPHQYIANQLQSQLHEHNRALEYTISFLSLPSNSSGLK